MNRRDVLAGSVVVAAGVAAEAAGAKEPISDRLVARAAVDKKLEAQRQAWNRGDLVAFCADYADDAVFVSPSGVTRGRAEVLARYEKKYGDKTETLGTLTFEPLDVRSSADSVSYAMRWTLSWPDRAPASGLTLIVWTKFNSEWKLSQDASM